MASNRVHLTRAALAALVIAPLAFFGFYMWALWNPGDTVSRLPVAIVDTDTGADLDGTRLTAGADVAAALLDGGDVDWQLVTLDEARAGVEDGRYYFSVVIPEDFSRAIADAANGQGRKARLEVVYNDHNSLVATPVGESVIAQVRSAVSESIGEQSVDEVLLGLGEVGQGLSDAAVGADQLNAGTGEALAGTTELAAGSVELSTGLGQAHSGSLELVDGTGQLAAGAGEARTGSGELATGLGQLVAGTDQLGAGASQISEVIETVVGPLVDAAVAAGLPTADDEVVGQLKQLREGAKQIAYELSDPNAEYRGGLNAAAAGAVELNTGLGQLADGTGQLDSGARELAAGLGQLNDGGGQLRDGLAQLEEGLGQLDSGSAELATGLADGAGQVPTFTTAERTATASMLSAPVTVEPRNIQPAVGFGPGVLPVLTSVLLFLIGILTWFVVRPPHGPHARHHESILREGLRRYRVPAIVTAVAAAVMAVVSMVVAGAQPPSVLALFAVLLLVGAAAVASARLFTVVFGPVNGTFVGLGALMIQVFAFGGVFPIEQMAPPLRWLHDLMPLTYARNAIRMSLVGYWGPRFWLAVAVLVVLTAGSVALTVWWRGRHREEDPVDDPDGDVHSDPDTDPDAVTERVPAPAY